MTLIDTLHKKIAEKRKGEASPKEIFLFDYLDKNITDSKLVENGTVMDKICYSAFFRFNEDLSLHIQQQQNSSEIKGLHYKNNFIELLAMAKHNFDYEKENIKNYVANIGTLKENFIINKIFPQVGILENPKINDVVDDIVDKIIFNDKYENLGELAIEAIKNASDLLDLFIIKYAIQKAWSIHPNKELERDISDFIRFYQKIKQSFESEIRTQFIFLALICCIIYGVLLFFLIPKYWESKALEPLFIALDYFIRAFLFITTIVVIRRMPSLKSNYNRLVDERVSTKILKLGIFKAKLDDLENKYPINF